MGDKPHRCRETAAGVGQAGVQPVGLRTPDATGRIPVFGGDELVVEVKTRGPAAFKRWQTMGAEISHPDSVAQAAVYTYGLFNEPRPAVIATMDTGSRQWDFEVIPASRVTTRAREGAGLALTAGTAPRRARAPTPTRFPGGTSPREAGDARAARSWPAARRCRSRKRPEIDEVEGEHRGGTHARWPHTPPRRRRCKGARAGKAGGAGNAEGHGCEEGATERRASAAGRSVWCGPPGSPSTTGA